MKDDVINAGGHYEDSEVVRDGNLISSRNPDDLGGFCREIISAIGWIGIIAQGISRGVTDRS